MNHTTLREDVLRLIAAVLDCRVPEIEGINELQKGMTNHSFLFRVRDNKYIMRIPGEGTEQLINRREEADVYSAISGLGFCDEPVFIDPQHGYKITRFLDHVRTCDPESEEDLGRCMDLLRDFHERRIQVPHRFDLFERIRFYESLWAGAPSAYTDYQKTLDEVMSLRPFLDGLRKEFCLTHIDAVPDNFLFFHTGEDTPEALQLTDWEYAGMQDPHVDIAMFCIYSLYDREQCNHLIDIYFRGNCDRETRIKIYAYIAVCGLLWSNWCEYKLRLGIGFGEYSIRQYDYAREFCARVREYTGGNGG